MDLTDLAIILLSAFVFPFAMVGLLMGCAFVFAVVAETVEFFRAVWRLFR